MQSVAGGLVLLVVLSASSWAQDKVPPSLSASVRAALASAEGAAKGTNKEEKSAEKSSLTTDGIDLPGMPPLSEGVTDQLNLEQQAEEAAARAAEEQTKREEEHNRKSYGRATQGLLPLSPDQVRDFMQKLESTQEAALPPHTGTPKGEVKVVGISLDPSGEPPQINLAAGYVTTIDIIDMTGEPWPILDVGVGGNFEVTPTQAGSHVVRVVPLTRFGTGNLSILLKGLSTPIIFRLSSGGPTFHMRFDARVPSLGPNAKSPLIEHRHKGPVAGDEMLSMILENAPPANAQRLKVGGVDARTMAWQVGERVYVRTPLALLSPAWNASAASSDGMTVYEIGNAPVLLMSDNGAMIRARLMREDGHDK
ncbi:MAG: DotH/IcmK family type IV secretion protein [Bdellovibrionales bacterium]|jgi:intracellular multiplication protein IcmK